MASTDRDQINSAMGGSQDGNQDDYQSAMGGVQPAIPGGAILASYSTGYVRNDSGGYVLRSFT